MKATMKYRTILVFLFVIVSLSFVGCGFLQSLAGRGPEETAEGVAEGPVAKTPEPVERQVPTGRNGKITGKTIDQEGNPLRYVQIVVEGATLGAVADEHGDFFIVGVPPGSHTLRACMIGFSDVRITDVSVSSDLTTHLGPIWMREKVIQGEEIAVVAERPLIQTDVTDSRRDIRGESIESIMEAIPEEAMKAQSSAKDRENDVHMRGGRAGETTIIVDGMTVHKPSPEVEPCMPEPLPAMEPRPMSPVEVQAERPPLIRPDVTATSRMTSREGVETVPPPGPPRIKKTRRPERKRDPWETTGLDTEIWIIERSDGSVEESDYEAPLLKAKLPEQEKEIPLPLKHTDVKARIDVFIATVEVTQQYHNPYDTKIEAVYVFPLPQSSAVTDFLMIIGDRRIRGLIREREEAKRIYQEAKARGHKAALLTQERPNIFTQRVANIEPGKDIEVQTTFFNPLKYVDGEYEFIFPTVVGPRFNPPGWQDGIAAVTRRKDGKSGQPVEVEYLKPGEPSGHDIAIEVDIDAGVAIEEIYSKSHKIEIEKRGKSRAIVGLSPTDRLPDKDFVLRYRTAGNKTKTAMMVHRAEDGNYFALVLQPPADLKDLPRMPREMVFVVDCSGSMTGEPISKAKAAMRQCLRNLDEHDTFQIIRFSNSASRFGPTPVAATPENVQRAFQFINGLRADGGTMMIRGVRAALDFPHDENRLRIVSFMTDGYIGNESEILAAVQEKVKSARIFSFGVGTSVNRYLLEHMAKLGRGAVAYVGLHDNTGDKVDQFYERATRPAMADIEIDWGNMEVTDVYPKKIPDLLVGRPIVITGRFKGKGSTKVKLFGRTGGESRTVSLRVNMSNTETEHQGIRSVWARWKIADLSEQETYASSDALKAEIIKTSIDYGLICRYTAFLAVDGLEKTAGDHGITVNVPVYVPEGVRYETSVSQ